jgi:hypothetical protein
MFRTIHQLDQEVSDLGVIAARLKLAISAGFDVFEGFQSQDRADPNPQLSGDLAYPDAAGGPYLR